MRLWDFSCLAQLFVIAHHCSDYVSITRHGTITLYTCKYRSYNNVSMYVSYHYKSMSQELTESIVVFLKL